MAGSSSTTTIRVFFMEQALGRSLLLARRGKDDVERAHLVTACWRLDRPGVDDERRPDEVVLAVERVALEVQLRDEEVVAGVVDGVVDVGRPPGAGPDLIPAGLDRLVLV